MKGEEESIREEIKKIDKKIGVKIEMEEIRRVKTGREEKGEMVIIKVKSEDNKRKGDMDKGESDIQGKTRWRLKKIAEEKGRRGRVVRLGYNGLWLDSKWWYWNEEKRDIKDRGRETEGK